MPCPLAVAQGKQERVQISFPLWPAGRRSAWSTGELAFLSMRGGDCLLAGAAGALPRAAKVFSECYCSSSPLKIKRGLERGPAGDSAGFGERVA